MGVIADRLLDTGATMVPGRHSAALPKVTTEQVGGAEWDRLIANFDEVCQEQVYAYAAARWPSARLEPVQFRLGNEVVGGALMMVQSLPLGLAHVAIAKWAPMLRDSRRPDADVIHAAMTEALVRDYADSRGFLLSVLPRAAIGATNHEYRRLEARGFRRGSQLLFPDRYIVNLRLSDEEQRRSFQQTWRRQLNKAEKSGLSFEHADPDRIGEFDALYTAMTDRKRFTDHSAYDTVPALLAAEPALRPELFFVRHEGELVAGALIFKAGDRAVYLYGATNDRALPLRAGYFMHWHVIRWLRDHTRATWYDLGGTDGFQGLHQFKKGMVGDAGVIRPIPPVANYASNRVAYLFGTGAFAARDAMFQVRRVLDGWRNPKSRPNQTRNDTGEDVP